MKISNKIDELLGINEQKFSSFADQLLKMKQLKDFIDCLQITDDENFDFLNNIKLGLSHANYETFNRLDFYPCKELKHLSAFLIAKDPNRLIYNLLKDEKYKEYQEMLKDYEDKKKVLSQCQDHDFVQKQLQEEDKKIKKFIKENKTIKETEEKKAEFRQFTDYLGVTDLVEEMRTKITAKKMKR